MIVKIKSFLKNENGATAIEYGLIAALMSVVILGALNSSGTNLTDLHDNVSLKVGTAMKNAGK